MMHTKFYYLLCLFTFFTFGKSMAITTCPGVAVEVPAPEYGQELQNPACGYYIEEYTVDPDIGVVSANDAEGFWLAPTETTTYTIKRIFTSAVCPADIDVSTITVEVDVDPDCGIDLVTPVSPLDDFPWAIDIIAGQGCDLYSSITGYLSGGYYYLYFESAGDGINSVLYNETGQLYCTETGTYDCVAAYGFTDGQEFWNCEGPVNCGCLPDGPEVCGSDGLVYANGCLAECAGVTWVEGPCTVLPPVIGLEDYPWAVDLIGDSGCSTFQSVTTYQSGAYTYLYFEAAGSGNSLLYNSIGQLYCTETGNYDCIAAYGFTGGEVIWNCSPVACLCAADYEPVCANGIEYLNACVASCSGVTDYTDGPCNGGTEFPWLNDLLSNSNCCEVNQVYLYTSGAFQYVYVVPEEACGFGTLYNAEGQFYCMSSDDYDCLSLYGFGNGQQLYACGGTPLPTCDYETIGIVRENDCAGAGEYLIELPDGSLLDPHLLDIEFDFILGGQVAFTFAFTDFGSPCGSEAIAADIICIQHTINEPPYWYERYPWLTDIIDQEDCCGVESIVEYSNQEANQYYLVIYPNGDCGGSPVMYNASGLKYCTFGPGYDCLALYGISNWETFEIYTCAGKSAQTQLDSKTMLYDLEVFPNPSVGPVTVTVGGDLEEAMLQVIDLSGKQILSQRAQAQNQLDLSGLSSGMYLIQVIHPRESLVKRVMIGQ